VKFRCEAKKQAVEKGPIRARQQNQTHSLLFLVQ